MSYASLVATLTERIDAERVLTDPSLCLAYGTDASFYRLLPKVVLRLDSLDEVLFAMASCRALGLPFTFRAAGTSLSGQAVSDSVLITLSDKWRGHKVWQQGERISLQPGVIGSDANRYLAPFLRKIGPDPASIDSCKIGGIVANNASGMCCGTAQNSYRTLDTLTVALSDGTVLDTSSPESVAAFRKRRPELLAGLSALRQEVLADDTLSALIRHKYRLKNTTGYALNALVDFEDPIDILAHLMVGSEGTLGFIAEVTYRTVPDHPHKATALLVFADVEQASQAVSALAKTEVSAVELMDGRSLKAVADKPGMPGFVAGLSLDATALLVDCRAASLTGLEAQCQQVMAAMAAFTLSQSVPFSTDPKAQATLWGIRKGLFPAVGAVRETGTTVIIEDVAFPVEELANGVRALQQLFDQHGYHEALLFGHALAGNLHFVFTQGFGSDAEVKRYGAFMDAVAELVAVRFGGSLKAEHGTGRNMAPYVELEWGPAGYQLMQRIKALFDPEGLLNPGVIINPDPAAHLKDLKPLPAADPLVDACIECGFCEVVCPSRTLSLSPRQRIVLYRDLQQRRREGQDTEALAALFEYQGLDTCAATGLCAERCPVGINTGSLVKKLRQDKYRRFEPIARWTAEHFGATTSLVKTGLRLGAAAQAVLGGERLEKLSDGVNRLSGGRTPRWLAEMPKANGAKVQAPLAHFERRVLYMPSCASRVMGQQQGNSEPRSLTDVTLSLLQKADFDVALPEHLASLCCGMPYDSKGMGELAASKARELEAALWQASEQGRLPVLMDTSPCALRSIEQFEMPLTIFEPASFAMEYLLPHLKVEPLNETVLLHITCSARRMGQSEQLLALAKACAKRVVVPEHIQCCGFAGDKGFSTPELNAASLAPLAEQVPADCKRGFSNSRTCEIGLSRHSGVPYQSLLYLLDDASRP
ncbi:FAD-binding and (Fe-S)-binding domain-containing protein [Gallaecimonas pentaromativorans]|uniref:FAD-binding and (Fe-S)-binding domain-containing protein n=1 Tax=Gallaecimonas pentaromativorans TaxID=584787 RepID=UPI003A905CD4